MKKIYIVMQALPTFINKYVSFVTRFNYTHFSISFDENLSKLYSFQIKNMKTVLVGGFMEEEIVLYFHGKKNIKLEQMVFEIPVDEEEHANIEKFITDIKNDNEYIFNYISCWLEFPFGGKKAYKSYHCVEFICEILKYVKNIKFKKKIHKMYPRDLYNAIKDYKHEYRIIDSNDYEIPEDNPFYKKIKLSVKIKKSIYTIKESFVRAFLNRTSKKIDYRKTNLYMEDCIND